MMNIINCNKYEVKTMTLRQYMKTKSTNKIVTDDAFQANSGYTKKGKDGRWNKPNNTSYLTNLIRGHAPSNFVFADMDKCLAAMKKQKDKLKDELYYSTWLSLGKYMNMDSYNRNLALGDYDIDVNNAISGFFADEIPIQEGVYLLTNGKSINIDSSNNIWSKMPKDFQNHILDNIKITIVIYEDCTQMNLSEICRAVNEGVPFTPAIYRNTFTTDVAREVRNIAKTEIKFFDDAGCKWFTDDQKIKREVDATIARMFYMTIYAFDIKACNDKALLEMYTSDVSKDKLKKGITLINEFLKMLKNCKDGLGRTSWYAVHTKIVVLFHLFDFFLEAKQKKLEIDKNRLMDMFNDFVQVYSNLVSDETTLYPAPKGKKVIFKTIKNGTQVYNIKLFKEILKDKFKFEDYCYEKGKRLYNRDDKLTLAINQGWQTPEGHKIEPSTLLDVKINEGGHKVDYATSKNTSLANGAIQRKVDNRKLGANPIVYAND